jgi:hypothetical protein
MSTQTAEPVEMGTRPIPEHEWLQKLVGEWNVETEMSMGPDQPKQRSQGTESIKNLGGLWAFGEGKTTMPGGAPMTYYAALGYDVTLKQYRSCWIASVSSHLWTKAGSLSSDGRVLTLEGEGPDMERDTGMTRYRDVFEIVDENHFVFTNYGPGENGGWQEFMKADYTRK